LAFRKKPKVMLDPILQVAHVTMARRTGSTIGSLTVHLACGIVAGG
jgi:hypothetical protein